MLPKSHAIFNAIIARASTTFKAVLRDSRALTIVELGLCKRSQWPQFKLLSKEMVTKWSIGKPNANGEKLSSATVTGDFQRKD